jgi:hypothetical protein
MAKTRKPKNFRKTRKSRKLRKTKRSNRRRIQKGGANFGFVIAQIKELCKDGSPINTKELNEIIDNISKEKCTNWAFHSDETCEKIKTFLYSVLHVCILKRGETEDKNNLGYLSTKVKEHYKRAGFKEELTTSAAVVKNFFNGKEGYNIPETTNFTEEKTFLIS